MGITDCAKNELIDRQKKPLTGLDLQDFSG
jgi:hypothetical protein